MAVAKAQTSRRQFVIGASIAAAGAGVLASAGKAMASEPEAASGVVTPTGSYIVDADDMTWERETEVLIIGCGGAGAAAALSAQENGADVLILEGSNIAGGSTAVSGQAISAGGTDVQIACGIEDSPEDFADFLIANSDGDPELSRLIGLNSLDTYNWMEGFGMTVPPVEGVPGVTFGSVHEYYPHVPRTHWTDSGIWPVLSAALEDNGIETLLNTPATALISDGATGDIIGAMSGDKAYKATKAVILAAGGLTNNPQLVHDHITTGLYVSFARDTDNGDGLKLGESVGAEVGYTNSGNDTPAYYEPAGACTFLVESSGVAGDPPFIAVNKQAQRFVDEGNFQLPINKAIMNQTDGMCYVIACGEEGLAGFALSSGEHIGELPDSLVQADNIADLAVGLDLDPETLEATVDTWNLACAEGVDTAFGRDRIMKPLDEPPYGAMAVYPGFAGSLAELVTNTNFEVQSALKGESIGRLYAVGANGCSCGRSYCCCGTAVSNAITSGRLAGAITAALDPWE